MKGAKRILVITGVPGTGKTTLAEALSKKLGDTEVVHVTSVVNRKKLFSSLDPDGAKVVRMQPLKKELERMIARSNKRNIILESHLLCDIALRGASALVLREHLRKMEQRLRKRGYGTGKIKANLVSEATDYCGIHAERNFSMVFESFSDDRKLVANAVKLLEGRRPKGKPIELMQEFDRFLRTRKELAI